jgi:hypothetical protein
MKNKVTEHGTLWEETENRKIYSILQKYGKLTEET